jgi:hypothetical protein
MPSRRVEDPRAAWNSRILTTHVLNDGEVSKPSYATYVKDRLTGFGGEGSIEEVAAAVFGLDEFS